MLSLKDRWLLAKMAAPDAGMFSIPRTHGRNNTRNKGPRMKVLRKK
jgi:hypothetical protein